MKPTKSRTFATSALAGLAMAGGAALWSAPALASIALPGVGVIVKKGLGDSPIVLPSDGKGEVRLTGLTPGDYTVRVIGGARETPMRVGDDGRLAFAAYEDVRRPRRGMPVVRRWAEPIAFGAGGAAVFDLRAALHLSPPVPCAVPPPGVPSTCGRIRSYIDLNESSPEQMVRLSPGLTMQAAVHIAVQREKGGPYTSIEDLARRNCPTMAIELSQSAVKIGEAAFLLAPAGGAAAVPGFRCGPGERMFRLYHAWHGYVGHVTLLR